MNPVPPEIRIEPTLGDILGAAIAGEAARILEVEEQKLAAKAQYLSAWRLADDLAPVLGVLPDDVFNALTYVPDNMLGLLCSPEGWGMLAEFVAGRLNIVSPSYNPAIH